jgi:hypothetical protein
MNSIGVVLLGAALISSVATHPLQVPQIKRNSQKVVDWFVSASGNPDFGCNDASFAYIDRFLTRQASTLAAQPETADKVVNLLGSFLGQCVVQVYGGHWVASGTGVQVEVRTHKWVHHVQPFEQVARRLHGGQQDSLLGFYRDLLPTVFGKQPESASAN